MSIMNDTVFMPSVLTFIGIPGLETVQCWIGIPFCAMYIIALMGNSLLLIVIKSEPSLHEPMYIFLAMWEPRTLHLAAALSPRCLEFFGFTCQRSILMLASFRCGSSTHFRVLNQESCWPWLWTAM